MAESSRLSLDTRSDWPWLLKNLFSIAQHSNEPVCIAWGKDLTTFCNDAFSELIDHRTSRSGQSLKDLLAPLWETISTPVKLALQGKEPKPERVSLWVLKENKNQQDQSVFSCVPIHNENGQVTGLYCTFKTLPESSRDTGTPFADEKAVYGNFLDEIRVGVMQLAQDTRILYANRTIKKLLGYTDETFPVSFNDLLHPQNRKKAETVKSWQELWYTTSHFHIELPLRCQDGSYILTNNEISLKLDDKRKPAYALIATLPSDKDYSGERRNLFLYDRLTSLPSRNYADFAVKRCDRSFRQIQTEFCHLAAEPQPFQNG